MFAKSIHIYILFLIPDVGNLYLFSFFLLVLGEAFLFPFPWFPQSYSAHSPFPHAVWLEFSAISLYLAMLPPSLFPGPLAVDSKLLYVCIFIFYFWYAHYSFWLAGFLSSKSEIYKVKRKPKKLTTILFYGSQVPWLICIIFSIFQSPSVCIFHVMSNLFNCAHWNEQEKSTSISFPEMEICTQVFICERFVC